MSITVHREGERRCEDKEIESESCAWSWRRLNQISAGAPITAAVMPLGTTSSAHTLSPMASMSVASSNNAPSSAPLYNSILGVRAPSERAIFGVNKPIKPITPTAVIDADTNQIPPAIRNKKAGNTAKPRAAAPSWPSRSKVSTRGANSSSGMTKAKRGSNQVSHSQPFCAKSPAPHINTF
ncbi:Uncharacterised protein [Vibrio cholerae]|nr:Uncharacterised protein [Vibrio cholerae]